jgi:tryptophan synthase
LVEDDDTWNYGLELTSRAFVTFITAGFPTRDSTVPLMFALEAGGADIIELGMPFSDPIGDGPTIQRSNTVSLALVIGVLGESAAE